MSIPNAALFAGLRVLVACEFSGTVRDAFRAHGADAMSCDFLPTEAEGPHYQGDVRDRIVRLMGDVPRVELFARERVQGWEAWGNEVETNDQVDAPSGARTIEMLVGRPHPDRHNNAGNRRQRWKSTKQG